MKGPIYATHHDAGPGVGPGRVVPASENLHADELMRATADRDRWRLAHDAEQAERQHLRRALDRLEAELFAAADELESARADRDRLRFERDAAEAALARLLAPGGELARVLARPDTKPG